MEIFAFNPNAGNETLPAFNERVKAFCLDTPVLHVEVSTADEAIVLSLVAEEDDASISPLLIVPVIASLTAKDMQTLEDSLGQIVTGLAAQETDDNPFAPFQVKLYPTTPGNAYAVILVAAGVLEEAPAESGDQLDGE